MINTAHQNQNSIEQWRDIKNYEGLYQASSMGRIRALRFRNGTQDKLLDCPRILSAAIAHSGYLRVRLHNKNKPMNFLVHRLVLAAFNGDAPQGTEAGHLDGNRLNNASSNLAWITRKENAEQRAVHGTQQFGEKVYNAKLTEAAVREIRATYCKQGYRSNYIALAERFGVTPKHIFRVLKKIVWAHV